MALFHSKIKKFVRGREDVISILERAISEDDIVIWVHVASLGEFEQGLPIIEKLKIDYPSYKIVLSFFSPSGYEVKKNTDVADVVVYLPLDTTKNAKRFIKATHPKLALFIKYEIWPNYLKELGQKQIPTVLISALFKEKQIYFKGYGGFMRKALAAFTHFFVQDENSKRLLASIDIDAVTISGDTRLDRVSEILERDNTLSFMDVFTKDQLCIVAGSTWPEDESILIDYINSAPEGAKFVLAPHTIKEDKISRLKAAITRETVLYSKIDERTVSSNDVLIIDTIGLLTKIYSYADIAYVGGGFATGLHNTLEPSVFGIPVIIGPNYSGFKEAQELVAQKGILSIQNGSSFNKLLKKLTIDPIFRKNTGAINASYIAKNKGASIQIIEYIRTLL